MADNNTDDTLEKTTEDRLSLTSEDAPATETSGGSRFKQKEKKRRTDVLLYVGVALITVAVAIAGFLIWRYVQANATYVTIERESGFDREAIDSSISPEEIGMEIDWDALHEINTEIVGWLYVPNTNLSYPIVHGSDNSYYLNHTADRTVNASGAIFLDYENSSKFRDSSTFIYGHNMLGNAMFSEMTGYIDESFLRAHPRILIFTPTETFDLTVIGAIKCKGTDPVRRLSFYDNQDFKGYLDLLAGYLVSGDYQELTNVDNIYAFSTCELFDLSSRIIVLATDTNRATEGEAAACVKHQAAEAGYQQERAYCTLQTGIYLAPRKENNAKPF
ncbi:MAG: class B sortase [Coriobacteriia bacterium]|nr:class B sortase [Coriobacteriia bacterium]